MVHLGGRIKKLREARGMSQEALAGRLGVSRPTVSFIENGSRKVTAEELKKVSDLFGVRVEALFDESKEPRVFVRETGAEYRKAEPGIRIDVPRRNLEKFKEVLLYILNKVGAKSNVGETVIYKLLFFIDFDYYERYEEQMIGATYMKNKYGPTPLEFQRVVEDMIRDEEVVKVSDRYFEYPQTKYLPCRGPDLSLLSAGEKDVIDGVLDRLSDMNAARISEYSHNDVPWLTTEEGGIIPYEAVFYRTPAYSARKDDIGAGVP
ncbi:MAG: repressor protein [Candidatus Aminicenantes bacterium RBG_13_59_9]|nr:MAG: repressor protein [Candidatus Aminicenantes bacterium RBG_13_59_9]